MARPRFGSAILLASALAGTPATVAPQQPPTAESLARDLAEAHRLLDDRQLAAAEAAFRRIVDGARRAALEAEEAQAQCGLGEALLDKEDYRPSQTAFHICLDMAERLGDRRSVGYAARGLSGNASVLGQRQDAIAYADRSVAAYDAIQDRRGRAAARLQRLRAHDRPFAEVESMYPTIVEDARSAGDRVLEGSAYHSWGDELFTADRYEEALDKLLRARDLFHAVQRFDAEGTVYNSIGRVYRAHGRIEEALKYQRQALALHEMYGTSYTKMQSHNAVAVVEGMLGHAAESRLHYQRALELAEQSGSKRIENFLRGNVAIALVDEGKFDEGARGLEQVIADDLDPYQSLRYAQLSSAYLRLKRPADALDAARRAYEKCQDRPRDCVNALDSRAAAFAAVGDRPSALADVRTALDLVEKVRTKLIPVDFLKENFGQSEQNLYSRGIALALDQHEDRESLEIAEKASARAFIDLLAARGAAAASSSTGDVASPATAAAASADDLVAVARRLRSTVVVYWPANDELFVWIVHPDGAVAARRVAVTNRRLVELIAATVREATPAANVRPWRQLYELLVAPIRAELPRPPGSLLTIIPHGVIHTVSFAALQARGGRYLIEDYTLHYAPAGAVLNFTADRRVTGARRGTALLVADPVLPPRSALDTPLVALPAARREVADIAALLPRQRVTVLEGGDATEARVRTIAANTAIVHFATHAILRDDDPSASYLALAGGGGGEAADGLLTARDVYDWRLKADLVVLSACQSAGGRITGDGIATFARGFLYAGTPSLVASLWDVADQASGRLLPAFYRSWLGGATKARSLRRAQLDLLAELRAGKLRVATKAGPAILPERPAYWAGFVLIGEPE